VPPKKAHQRNQFLNIRTPPAGCERPWVLMIDSDGPKRINAAHSYAAAQTKDE
jgi:hypothetical protein